MDKPVDEVIPQMDAPDMWGFDPDALYPWTPKQGREVLDKGKYDDDREEWITLPKYGAALPTSPVFLFKALRQVRGDEIETQRRRHTKTRHEVLSAFAKAGHDYERENPGKLYIDTPEYQRAKDEANEAILSSSERCYSSDLINSVIRESLAGWRNVRGAGREIAFSGDWDRDEVVVRRWKAEAFNAIVEETMFLNVADSFTSARDLPPG